MATNAPKLLLSPYLSFCYRYKDKFSVKVYIFGVKESNEIRFKFKKIIIFPIP